MPKKSVRRKVLRGLDATEPDFDLNENREARRGRSILKKSQKPGRMVAPKRKLEKNR